MVSDSGERVGSCINGEYLEFPAAAGASFWQVNLGPGLRAKYPLVIGGHDSRLNKLPFAVTGLKTLRIVTRNRQGVTLIVLSSKGFRAGPYKLARDLRHLKRLCPRGPERWRRPARGRSRVGPLLLSVVVTMHSAEPGAISPTHNSASIDS